MSVEKITDKIISDAELSASGIVSSAAADAKLSVKRATDEAGLRAGEIAKKAAADAAEVERRRMLTASLDARKNTLGAKRQLIDRVFDAALDAFLGLSDAEHGALVVRLVAENAETGDEEVVVPSAEEKRYKALLPEMNAALKKEGKPGNLTFGGTAEGFRGGVMLRGEVTDIDCSFESLISQFRDENEMSVASILFGSEV